MSILDGIIEENLLDKYDSVTYHIKFYMMSEKSFSDPRFSITPTPIPSDTIIIAESGVTGEIMVDSMTLTSYPGPGASTKNAIMNEAVLTLREFSGSTLIDKIVLAANRLGIKNYLSCPYFIELTFRAYDHTSGQPVKVDGLLYRWPVMIKGITSSVDIGGTTYTITAYNMGDAAGRDELTAIKRAFSYRSSSTVERVLKELAIQLQIESGKRRGGVVSNADDFEIFIDETTDPTFAAIAKSKVYVEADLRTNPTTNVTTENTEYPSGKTEVAIEKNTPVIDVINRIITSSEEYKKLMLRSDNTENPDNTDPNKLKVCHSILFESSVVAYDALRKDYKRRFIYRITKHESGLLTFTPKDIEANSKTRFNNYNKLGLIKKRYKYIFTGENDQVLRFDLNFNNAWYAALPVNDGINTSISDSRQGVIFKDMKNSGDAIVGPYYSMLPKNPATPEIARQNLSNLEKNVTVDLSTSEAMDTWRKNKRIGDSVYINSARNFSYAEDFIPMQVDKYGDNTPIPMRYINSDIAADKQSLEVTKSIEQPKGKGAKYVNSMFQQAFAGMNGDLLDIEMTIKGDPYWLGMTVIEADKYRASKKDDFSSSATIAFCPKEAMMDGNVSFVFTVGNQTGPNETTTKNTSMYNGLYIVRQVIHEFSDGKFTQTLFGALDTRINVNELLDD